MVICQEGTGGEGFSSAFCCRLHCEMSPSAQIQLVKKRPEMTEVISKGFYRVSVLDGAGIYVKIVKESHGISCH